MAEFKSNLFVALAEGPQAFHPGPEEWTWSTDQVKDFERSKDLLYRMIMLSAARYMIVEKQDSLEEGKRKAIINFSMVLTTNAKDRECNGPARENHQVPADISLREEVDNFLLASDIGVGIGFGNFTESDFKTKIITKTYNDDMLIKTVEDMVRLGSICPTLTLIPK